jgi:hypothetical protein
VIARSPTVAESLLDAFAPRFRGQKLGQGSILAIGIVATLVAIGFGALAVFTFSTADTGLAPQFGYGMLVMAIVCLLVATACFVPTSRWWAIPVIMGILGAVLLIGQIARQLQM